MASMNRGLNLPQIQRIMTEFEKESSMMDMKEEMMSDAVDDVMDEEEDEEEEGDKILKQVLDEIGVDLSQQVRFFYPLDMQLSQSSTLRSLRMLPLASRPHPNHWQTGNLWHLVTMVGLLRAEEVNQEVIMVEVALPSRMKMHYRPDWMLCGEDETKLNEMLFCIGTTVYLNFQGGDCSCFLGS